MLPENCLKLRGGNGSCGRSRVIETPFICRHPSQVLRVTGPVVYLLDRRDVACSALAAAERQLSPEDRARHAAFRRPERQEQFTLGRALLRRAAAHAMDCEPASLDITSHADGRAQVTAPAWFRAEVQSLA